MLLLLLLSLFAFELSLLSRSGLAAFAWGAGGAAINLLVAFLASALRSAAHSFFLWQSVRLEVYDCRIVEVDIENHGFVSIFLFGFQYLFFI